MADEMTGKKNWEVGGIDVPSRNIWKGCVCVALLKHIYLLGDIFFRELKERKH